MASWNDIERDAPEFAARLRGFLDAHVHKTIATLRKDGSPRISGTETFFFDGHLWIGSMAGALKARDLQRDPRFALHSGSDDPPEWGGDGKVAGRAVEETDPEARARVLSRGGEPPAEDSGAHYFRLEIEEAAVVSLNDARDRLVIEVWKPGEGVRQISRT